MRAKLLAVAVAGLLALGADHWAAEAAVKGVGQEIVLVPGTLDGLNAARRWNHPLDEKDLIEDGAVFTDAAGERSVLLDFWRGARAEHDGIFCFVLQGESVLREQLIEVETRSERALFNVALLRNGGRMRLAASTHCRPEGCTAVPLRWGAAPAAGSPLAALRQVRVGLRPAHEPIVPVSLVLEYPRQAVTLDTGETSERLISDFRRVARDLDLAPVQQLARLYRPSN
jgi:hypothetical protein